MLRAGLSLAALSVIACASCSPDRTAVELEAIDLLALHQTGNARAETTTLPLHGEDRALHFRRGWAAPVRFGDRFLVPAIAAEAELGLLIVNPEGQNLAFDVSLRGPQPAPAKQEVSVFIGERLLSKVALAADAVTPVSVDLPARLLVRGDNRIRFVFAEVLANPDFATAVVSNLVFPSVAAYFSNLRLKGPDAAGPGAAGPGAAPQPAFQPSADDATLRQHGPSYVEHALRLVGGAYLDVGGAVHGDGGMAVIEWRRESQPAWRKLGTFRSGFQKRFRLKIDDGEIGQVRLTVPRGDCTWSAIRLSGVAVEPRHACLQRPAAGFRHVVFMVLDALRSDMLAAGGNRQGLTPTLDRLAQRAVVFDNVTSAAALTPASIYSYFTGENPYSRSLVPDYDNNAGARPTLTGASFELAAAFAAAGYRTVNIAGNFYCKADYGLLASFGEEHFIWPDVAENDRSPRTSAMDQGPVLKTIEEMAASDRPVMLYLHYLPPHLPYTPPEGYRGFLTGDTSARVAEFPSRLGWLYEFSLADPNDPQIQAVFDQYKENVHYADALVGEVIAALDQRNLLKDTLVLVTADHGEAFFEHGRFKHSSTVYDEMIRVPLLFLHPSLARRTVSEHVGLIDLVPTLVELCGLPSEGNRFEGRSLWPLLMGESSGCEDRWYFSIAAEKGTHFGFRTDKLKYIYAALSDQLYDLEADPRETRSIHETSPLLAAWLRQRGHLGMAGSVQHGVAGAGGELDENRLRNLRDLGYIR